MYIYSNKQTCSPIQKRWLVLIVYESLNFLAAVSIQGLGAWGNKSA